MSLVSILIPAYQSERYIAEAIESALAQTYGPIEVIVVDDGSTDGTLAVARSFEVRGVTVIHQNNAGACVARNNALVQARGEFVKFLDADDALAPDVIAVQLEALLAHQDDRRIVPFGVAATTDEELRPRASARSMAPQSLQFFSEDLVARMSALLAHNIQTSLPLHRRELLQQVGGFRPDLKRGQEYDLHLRLALAGARFLFVPHLSSYVRQHPMSDRISNTSPLLDDPEAYLAVQVERREMLEAYFGTPLPPPIAAELARSIWTQTRRLVQEGRQEITSGYVAEALYLDSDGRYAGGAFRVLSKLFGPVRAERLLMLARGLTRHF